METINNIANEIINPIIYLLIGVSLIAFLFGLASYLFAGGNTDKRIEASKYMLWGLVGLFITSTSYGLVAVVQNTVIQIAG